MKLNKLIMTLLLSLYIYEYTETSQGAKLPQGFQQQMQQTNQQLQQLMAQFSQGTPTAQGPGLTDQQQKYLQQAQQQIAGLQMPMQQQNQFLVQMQQLLMKVVQEQSPSQVHNLPSDQHIASEKEKLGDALNTEDKTLIRGLISKLIIIQAENALTVKSINDIMNFNPKQLQSTEFQKNLPSYLQAIFNFDSTLARSSIIYTTTMYDPFMTKGIPGVRLLKANGINPYQDIKEKLQLAPTGNQNTLNAIQGFITILLQLYSLEKKQHYTWQTQARPAGNNLLKAIIAEANSLVSIAQKHDPKVAKQLKWEVDSYHTWRRYTHYGTRLGIGILAGAGGALGMRHAGQDVLHQAGGAVAGVAATYVANKAHQHLSN